MPRQNELLPADPTLQMGVRFRMQLGGPIVAANADQASIGTTISNGAGGAAIVELDADPVQRRAASDPFPVGELLVEVDGGQVASEVSAAGSGKPPAWIALDASAGDGSTVYCVPASATAVADTRADREKRTNASGAARAGRR